MKITSSALARVLQSVLPPSTFMLGILLFFSLQLSVAFASTTCQALLNAARTAGAYDAQSLAAFEAYLVRTDRQWTSRTNNICQLTAEKRVINRPDEPLVASEFGMRVWDANRNFIKEINVLVPQGKSHLMNGLIDASVHLPADHLGRVDWVVIHEGVNPQDSYWKAQYRDFTESAATGGGGAYGSVIHMYRVALHSDRAGLLHILRHEMGHTIAYKLFGSTTPPNDYVNFASKDAFAVSEYGKNSWAEDFAEATRVYFETQAGLSKGSRNNFPNRFAYLDHIFGVQAAGSGEKISMNGSTLSISVQSGRPT